MLEQYDTCISALENKASTVLPRQSPSRQGGYTEAIELAKQLVCCKEKAVKIYDAAINKLARISETLASKGIPLGPEQNENWTSFLNTFYIGNLCDQAAVT